MKKIFINLIVVLLLTGCGKIDDLMLGKDNTPEPKGLDKFEPTLSVTMPWKVPVGSNGNKAGYLDMPPAFNETMIYTANMKGEIFALDRKTGEKIWENDLDQKLTSGPAVDEQSVVVTDKDAKVIVLDATTGKEKWKRTVSNEVFAVPALAEGKVFVKTVDGNLYAYDEADGHHLWTYNHGTSTLVLRAGSSPQVLMGVVVVGFADGHLVGLRADTGQILWEKVLSQPTGASDVERMADIDANPLVLDDTAYVSSYQQNISALSLRTGEVTWEKKELFTIHDMVADSTNLYIVDMNSVIWAIDRFSGIVSWKQKSFENRRLTGPALVAGDILVVGDYQGFVHWISTKDGHFITRTRPSRVALYESPVADGDHLYVLTSSGSLVDYQVPEGGR